MFGQPLSFLCASPVPPLCHHRRPMATNCDHRTHLLPSDHCATTVPPFCNHGNASASILPPLSNLYEINILGDHCATVLNMFKTSRRPWRPWRCLNLLCTTFERPMQPVCLLSASNDGPGTFYGRTREAQRSPSLCKRPIR